MSVYQFFQKKKRGSRSALYSTTIAMLAIVLTLFSTVFVGLSPVSAADGDSSQIELKDLNGNGKIDAITFQIENTGLNIWDVRGAASTALSVTQNAQPISVTGVAITSGVNVDPIIIQVTLDEADTDLVVDTNGVASNPIELVYVQNGDAAACADCITNETVELNAIASGDTGVADTEIDAAQPVISDFAYKDTDNEGRIDTFTATFSETLDAASVLAKNDLSLTVGDFTGAAFGADNTDLINASISSLDIALGTPATVQDTFEDSATIAVTSQNAFSLSDGTNVNTTLGALNATFTDVAAPVIKDFAYQDVNLDGMIDTVDVRFSETVDTPSILSNNDLLFTSVGDFTDAAFGGVTTDLIMAPVSNVVVTLGVAATVVDTNDGAGLAISTQNMFKLQDAAGNMNTLLAAQAQATVLDEASPIVVSAEFKDTDVNGQVDTFDITFSPDAGLACAFEVGDWAFPTAGNINVTASTGCSVAGDVLSLSVTANNNRTGGNTAPTVTYSDVGTANSVVDGAGNDIVVNNQTLADKAAPVFRRAEYRDDNGDGRVDQVAILVSSDSGLSCTSFNAGADFMITTSGSVNISSSAGDTCITTGSNRFRFNLANLGDVNVTGGAVNPVANYSNPGDGLEDGAGNDLASQVGMDIRDKTKPIVQSALYKDSNADGKVDQIDFTMTSEVSIDCTHEASDWTFPTPGTVNVSTSTGCSTAGNVLTLNVNADANITGGPTNPVVTYTDQGTGNQVQDSANNDLIISNQAVTDGAAPVVLSARYKDSNTDGAIDRIGFITSSENTLSCGGFTPTTSFTVTTAGTVNVVAGVADTCAIASSNEFEVVLGTAGTANTTGGATDPVVNYVQTGTGVSDGLTNLLPSANTITATDFASPIVQSASYKDINANGTVDRADFVLTADTGLTCTHEAGDWAIPVAGDINVTSVLNCAINGSTLELSIAVGNADTTGGAVNPSFTYTDQGIVDQATDGSGNDIIISSQEATDAAPALIQSAVYQDVNADGAVETIVFSTTTDTGITCTAFTGGTDLTVTTAGEVGLTSTIGDGCATNGTSTVTITLTTPGTANTTGGATTPVVNYVQPGNGLEDGAGNDTPSQAAISVADNASPKSVSSVYKDTNQDGTVDRFDILMTADTGLSCAFENTDWTFPTVGDITVSGATGCAINGDTIELGVTAVAGVTGGSTNPTVTYTDQGVVDQVQDGSNNDAIVSNQTTTDGASPVIQSGTYQDTNNDGEVDRVQLITTADTGIACTSFTGLTDLTIPNPGTIGLTPDAGDTCNTNGTTIINFELAVGGANNRTGGITNPQVTYTQPGNGLEDGAGNDIPTKVAQTLTDQASPVALSGSYKDVNADGTVDRFDILFTSDTGLSCAFENTDWTFPTAGDITVSGATSCNVNVDTIELGVTSAANITGGATNPAVTYTDQGIADQVKDGTGNDIFVNALAVTDMAAPVILSGVYQDSNTDGSVDRVVFTTSVDTGVSCAPFTGATDFTVTTAGEVTLVASAGDTCGSNGTSTVTIDLATPGAANVTGGATAPVVNYVQPGNGLEDGAGNDTPTANNVSLTDNASPVAVSATYKDIDSNGQVDRVDILMSADTALACAHEAGDWSFPTSGSINVTASTSCAAVGNTLQVGVTADANVTGGAVNPTVTYTDQGIADQIQDGLGNDAVITTQAATDAAAPVILSSVYKDTDVNGSIDTITYTLSTDTGTSCAFEAGDWVVATAGSINVNTPSACSAVGDTINLSVAADANETGGATNPQLTYTNQGTLGSIKDAIGNQSVTTGPVTATDAAGPVALSAIYRDINLDGTVDRVDVTFSNENTLNCAFEAGDYTFPAAGAINLTGATSCATVGNDLQLGVTANAGITGGAPSPTISYTDQGVADQLQDGFGNDATMTTVTVDDGAGPVALSATYKDINTDGQVDRIDIAFTESGITCTFEAGDWSFPAPGSINITAATGCTPNAAVLELAVTADINETGGAINPTVLYTDQGIADQIQDVSGNDAVVSTVTATDNASPVVISSVYQDVDQNGTVDQLLITLTTDTGLTCTFEAGDWSFPTAGSVNLTGATSCAIVGNAVQLGVTADANVTGGVTDPTVTYTDQGVIDQLQDGSGNDVLINNATATDNASPIVLSVEYRDTNTDGEVDQLFFNTTADTGIVCSNYTGLIDLTVLTAGTVNVVASAGDICGSNGTNAITISLATVGANNTTGGPIAPVIRYNQPGNGIEDGSGNDVPTTANLTAADKAAPLIIALAPTPNEVDVYGNQNIEALLTETINTGSLAIGLNPTALAFTFEFDLGDTFFSANNLLRFSDGVTYTATINLTDLVGNAVAPGIQPTTFSYTIGDSRTGGGTSTALRLDLIDVADNSGGSTGGGGGGSTTPAPENTGSTGGGTDPTPQPPTDSSDAGDTGGLNSGQNAFGLDINGNSITTGSLVKGSLDSAVYYVSSTGKRHVFINQLIYNAWYGEDFSQVVELDDATMASLPMGAPVPHRPGVLLKTPSNPRVYLLSFNRTLKHIDNEDIALELFGAEWAGRIIDVPESIITFYNLATPILTASDAELPSLLDPSMTIDSQL